MKKIFCCFVALFFLHFSQAFSAISNWNENYNSNTKTRLLASFYDNSFGQKKLIAGIHFKIGDGWKVYGNDSEAIGMPPSLDFSASKNLLSNQITWPKAENGSEKIGKETLQYSYYKNEVVLPVTINIADLNTTTELDLKLDYAVCKDVCIPISEKFTLKITDEIDQNALAIIQKYSDEKLTDTTTNIKNPDQNFSLMAAILLAIFGGAILNIMPCVLPVLSIKLLSVINHFDAPIARIRFAFLATTLGILCCFIVFSILAVVIKFTGNSLGWGLQFQNPFFLIALILILVLFLGNLLGLFEITFDQFIATILNRKIIEGEKKRNIFAPNFLSGVLAVLLATPCSAPFLGTAISFALTQNFAVIFLIFSFVGIGFALPYIILLIAPKLVYLLPKPGNWMLQVKQLLAGLLAATIIWLIYVLSHIVGAMPAFLAGALAISLLACLKIKSDLIKYVAIALVITCSIALPSNLQQYQEEQKEHFESFWENFDENDIQHYVKSGRVVVVDITADWCLSCKFNKIRVLQDQEVMAQLKSGQIVAMRGNITKPNPAIMDYLHRHNRFAIPFNAIYGPSAPQGLLASEFLTKKELFELIEKAK